jgi:CubicO group peptidase (beta-lactamase class C family)
MKVTDFIIGPDRKTRLVTVHARKQNGSLDPMEFGVPQEPEFFMGGGGLYGTGRDYLAFLQMLMHGGEFNGARLLRPETVAQMSKNNIGGVNISRVVLKTTAPTSTPDIDFRFSCRARRSSTISGGLRAGMHGRIARPCSIFPRFPPTTTSATCWILQSRSCSIQSLPNRSWYLSA